MKNLTHLCLMQMQEEEKGEDPKTTSLSLMESYLSMHIIKQANPFYVFMTVNNALIPYGKTKLLTIYKKQHLEMINCHYCNNNKKQEICVTVQTPLFFKRLFP